MATAVDMDTADTAVDTAATDMGRGLLMLRPNPATAMVATVATDTAVVDMVVMAVATTAMARGRLRLSPRLMLLLRLSPAMATTAVVMEATARGLLSPAMDTAATAMVATDTAGATATAGDTATGVSYHQIRRSELSQKQNYKNSQR